MNNSVINIPGIHANTQPIDMQDSTDMAYLLTIKDEYGNEVSIYIINDKIDGKNYSSINKQ